MELRLQDSEKILSTDFGQWLIKLIRTRLISNSRKYNFSNIDRYLTESPSILRLYQKRYSTFDIIVFASQHLKCTGTDGEITIHFDNNVFVPGFDRWKLSSCLKTINFGTTDLKGCPIFTDTFNIFASDIDAYIRLFYNV